MPSSDPNYPWDILREDVADRLFDLLDPIVDHKKDTTENVNKLAEWVDELVTERYRAGYRDGIKRRWEAKDSNG